MLINLLAFYLIVVVAVFLVLLSAFLTDCVASKIDKLSWAVLVLGSLFWFIAIPISVVEILYKRWFAQKMMPQRDKATSNVG